MGNFPVYVSTVVAGLQGVALILSALAMAAGAETFLQSFMFSSDAVAHEGSLWRLFTYAFIHTPPYWVFLFELYLLVAFGREIETYFGRAVFLKLYLILLLAPTVFLALCDFVGWRTMYDGSSALHFGVFVAFALIYPTAEILFSIQAKWIALALLAVNSLQCLAMSNYEALAVLAVDCVSACLFIGYQQGRFTLRLPQRQTPTRRVARQASKPEPQPTDGDAIDAINPILEKISRQGMGSLTQRERERLEKARARLIAKDGGS